MIDRLIFSKHLEKGETILCSIHKHWIEVVKPMLEIAFFGLLLPWALYMIGFNTEVFFWIAVVWSMIAYLRFTYVLIDWWSDAWLITSMSVIAIEWNGLFSNNSARITFDDIEGVSYEIRGFLGTMLRFGNMELRVLSGSHAKLIKVANPKKAELSILRYQEKYLNDRNMQDQDNLKKLLSSLASYQNRGN